MICAIIFGSIVIFGLIILSKKYRWGGFKVRRKDILSWAIYGFIVPIWIQFEYIFENLNFFASLAATVILAVLFLVIFMFSKKKGFPMLPIIIVSTLLVFLILLAIYTPPTPSNWSEWFTFGKLKPFDIFIYAFWLAPPWIIGFSIARFNPRLVVILPVLVIGYWVMYFLVIPMLFISALGLTSLGVPTLVFLVSSYLVTALLVFQMVRRF